MTGGEYPVHWLSRFGDGYAEYRENTPAVFPRRRLAAFLRYLVSSPVNAERA